MQCFSKHDLLEKTETVFSFRSKREKTNRVHERLMLKGRKNLFKLSYAKKEKIIMSLFWNREDSGQTLTELSNSKDHET